MHIWYKYNNNCGLSNIFPWDLIIIRPSFNFLHSLLQEINYCLKMAVPTPESLSMDCGLKCDMCKESVNYGDDYIAQIQFAHSVTQNIPFFMNKALAKIKGEKRKIADVVTIEEEFSEVNEESIRSNEEGVADTLVLDANRNH